MSINEYLPISFRINGTIYQIELSEDDIELYNNLIDDNKFTLEFLNSLIESDEISLNEELEEIYRINPNTKSEDKIFPVELIDIVENKIWNDPETCLLLEKYETYIKKVGQCELYRNKKCMWEQIANDINQKFKMKKTAVQVENRFKTLLRRKAYNAKCRRADNEEDNNFEEKLRVLPSRRPKRKSDSMFDSSPAKKEKSLQEILEHIHNEKEAAKKRRHKEKLLLSKEHEAAKERRHQEKLKMFEKIQEHIQNKNTNALELIFESVID